MERKMNVEYRGMSLNYYFLAGIMKRKKTHTQSGVGYDQADVRSAAAHVEQLPNYTYENQQQSKNKRIKIVFPNNKC